MSILPGDVRIIVVSKTENLVRLLQQMAHQLPIRTSSLKDTRTSRDFKGHEGLSFLFRGLQRMSGLA